MTPTRAASSLLLSVVLLLPGFTSAQECDSALNYQQRGYPVDMDLSGVTLAIADGAGLTLVDVADPQNPVVRFSTFSETESLAVEYTGPNRVALLTRDGLHLYDVDDETPRLLDVLDVNGTDLHRFGGSLLVVGSEMTLIDTTGDSLSLLKVTPLLKEAVASAVVDSEVYVSIPGSGTTRFESSLLESGRIGVVATAIAGRDDVIYLGRGSGGLSIVDFSAPEQPVVLNHVSGGVAADQLLLIGDRLYAAGAAGSLHVMDVSDSTAVVAVPRSGTEIDLMVADHQYLYSYGFSSDRFGRRVEGEPYLTISDHGDPELTVVSTLHESTGPLSGVATDGVTAWIADPPFLRAIDLTTGGEVWSVRLNEPFDRIRFENGRLVLYGRTWVHLLDPYAAQKLLGTWDTKGIPGGGVTFSGPWLIEANKASGLHVLDISNPAQIIQRGGLINDGRGQWLDVIGIPGVVYGRTTQGMKIVSLGSNPAAVEVVDFLKFGALTDLEIVSVEGLVYLVVLDSDDLRVYDLISPLQPREISAIEVAQGRQLAVSDTRVWVLGVDGRVHGVDLANPMAPRRIGVYEGMREGLAIDVSGNILVGADRWALWATLLTPPAQLDQPHLMVTEQGEGAIDVHWSAPPVSLTEVQFSADEHFSDIENVWTTTAGRVSIEAPVRAGWVRARFIQGCVIGPWSAAVEIETTERPGRGRPVRRP